MLQPPKNPSQMGNQPQETDPNQDRNRQRGTGFTNISRVLGANQGAGQKMGQQIGSSLSNQAGQIKQGIQAGQKQFGTEMAAGSAGANAAIAGGKALQKGATDPNETDEAYARRLAGIGKTPATTSPIGNTSLGATGIQPPQVDINGLTSKQPGYISPYLNQPPPTADQIAQINATRLANSGNQYVQAQGNQPATPTQPPQDLAAQGLALKNAAYTGPQGLQNAGQLQSRAATASALGRLGATSAGQGQLLASQVAQRGNYGRGQGALDQMLLGRGGQQAIQQGRSALSGIQGQAQGAVQGAQAQAGATGQAIDASKVATQQALQNQLSGTGEAGAPKGFQQQAKEQAAQYNEQGKKIQQMLQGRNLKDGTMIDEKHPSEYTEEDIALLDNLDQYGLGGQDLYGKNAGEYEQALRDYTQEVDQSQNARYTGNQGAAAGNLASFLGDTQAQKAAGQTFNDKLFSNVTNQNATAQQKALQEQDVAKQGDISRNMAMQADLQTRLAAAKRGDYGYGKQADLSSINNVLQNMKQAGYDPNRAYGLLQGDLAANTGQSKSIKQAAYDRLGKKSTVKEAPEKKLGQKE